MTVISPPSKRPSHGRQRTGGIIAIGALFAVLGVSYLLKQEHVPPDNLLSALPQRQQHRSAAIMETNGEGNALVESVPKLKRHFHTAYDRLPEMRQNPQLVLPNPVDTSLKVTEAGVDISSPDLYQEGPPAGIHSRDATVIGMASGYSLEVYERFVGSLRKTGYQGHIILGVSPDVSPEILEYFRYRRVTPQRLDLQNCTYAARDPTQQPICTAPYLNMKPRWSRFPLQRDWLEACQTCTGPVITMDVRDSFFQQDPFGPGSPPVRGLMLTEEDASSRVNGHWLTDVPFAQCKGIHLNETMICSGTTLGTRVAMLKYFGIIYREMVEWAADADHCEYRFQGGDQAVHNYLYYSGQLSFATVVPNRVGGVVNTVGVLGTQYVKQHRKQLLAQGMTKEQAKQTPFTLGRRDNSNSWISASAHLTNNEGWFTEADGALSRVVHQYDRFGDNVKTWLREQDWVKDPIPSRIN